MIRRHYKAHLANSSPLRSGQLQERGCQVEYGLGGSNLELLKARFFALSVGRNLWKPYLSPSDCRNRIPLARARVRWVGNATDEHSNCEREGSPRVASGSVVAWQHINLHGEYDFAPEKL